jgi:hypothetical protein
MIQLTQRLRFTRNWSWGCAAAALLAAGTVTTQAGDPKNLLAGYNPDFAQTATDGSIPGWELTERGKAVIEKDPATGKNVLHLYDDTRLQSKLVLKPEPGYQYRMSVRVKIKNYSFIPKADSNLPWCYGLGYALVQYNAKDELNGDWYGMYHYGLYKEGNQDWTTTPLRETLFPLKETTTTVRPLICSWAHKGSEAWFSDIKIWKEPITVRKVAGTVNITENGSFEVRYDLETIPNGFEFPDGRLKKDIICVTDQAADRLASLRVAGDGIIRSNAGPLSGHSAKASLAIRTEGVATGQAFARIRLLDDQRQSLAVVEVAAVSGNTAWKRQECEITVPAGAKYAQWEFGLEGGSKGRAWFDALRIDVPTEYQALPIRPKNTAKATVTVDCGQKGAGFTSPLNAVDHHNADRVYSPSIGTAGPFVEGPGRWLQERTKLGFKYVRVHHIYDSTNLCTAIKDPQGNWKVSFGANRTHYPENDQPFGPVCTIGPDGRMTTDFSSIKYMLDKEILVGGVKPIIGLETVPKALAWEGRGNYAPRDYKLWEELNYRFITFLIDTYGAAEVKTWIFETGNEPGTEPEFHGLPGKRDQCREEFIKMQDYTVAGATRALPEIFIAGPSGPPEDYIEPMLEHCAKGVNFATGKIGTKIDAISYHGYLGGGHSDISWRQGEDQILRYKGYIKRYEEMTGKTLRLFNTEYTPIFFDGHWSGAEIPHDMNNHIQAVATLHMGNFSERLGVDLMAFFFHSPIYFAKYPPAEEATAPEFGGQATVITFHGIFTPVCRAYQLMGRLTGGIRVSAEADVEPVYALATVTEREIKVLVYSFDVASTANYTTAVALTVQPAGLGRRFKVTRYELSATKANSWYLAQQRQLTQAQCVRDPAIVDRINRESELKPENLGLLTAADGKLTLSFPMPAYSAMLYVFERQD